MIKPFQIHNRSYLGCKYRMLPFLEEVIGPRLGRDGTLWDAFGGTGVVAYHFADQQRKIIYSDILECNVVMAWPFLDGAMPLRDYWWIAERLNNLPRALLLGNHEWRYAQDSWGDKYFPMADAQRIDLIREVIAEGKIVESEDARLIAVCSLLYAVDRIAQTFGHYDAFKSKEKWSQKPPLRLSWPDMSKSVCPWNELYAQSANVLVHLPKEERPVATVAFLDPPYNTRDYGTNYHLLENLCQWRKEPVRGVTAKITTPKSTYASRRYAEADMIDLIEHIDAKHIVLTYNNQSSNTVPLAAIVNALKKRGKVEIHSVPHRIISGVPNNEHVIVCDLI